jgi:uncharacterized membrane protein YccC
MDETRLRRSLREGGGVGGCLAMFLFLFTISGSTLLVAVWLICSLTGWGCSFISPNL